MNQDKANMERVLIVGVELESDPIDIESSLDELKELVIAAGGIVVSKLIQEEYYKSSILYRKKEKQERLKVL